MEAELWALKDGLKLAVELNFLGIHVESDAKTMISLITQEHSVRHHFSNLICDCWYLMRYLRITKIDHILANQGRHAIDGFHAFNFVHFCLAKQ